MTDQNSEPQISEDQGRTLRQMRPKLVGLPELRWIEPPASGRSRIHLAVTIDVEYISIEGLQEIQRSLGAVVQTWCEEHTWPVAAWSLSPAESAQRLRELLENSLRPLSSDASKAPTPGETTCEGLRVG